jgi:hypothetical protein
MRAPCWLTAHPCAAAAPDLTPGAAAGAPVNFHNFEGKCALLGMKLADLCTKMRLFAQDLGMVRGSVGTAVLKPEREVRGRAVKVDAKPDARPEVEKPAARLIECSSELTAASIQAR